MTRLDSNSWWRWQLIGASALFCLGLYLNTGTLAPYGNTNLPWIDPATGYAYNTDHPHFRVLFDFVDGRDRSVWDRALFLRRILFPVLAWPFMHALGFETGGTVASLAFNLAGFVIALELIRRRIGEKGAIFAAWILSLSPGATYWGGLPYPYALIFPFSLLLFLALIGLEKSSGWRLAGLSLAMGIAYLGYDLAIYFVPAALLLLCLRRRFAAAIASVALQLAPIAAWTYLLVHVFRQPLRNSNSGSYASSMLAYLHPGRFADWWHEIARAPVVGIEVFLAANFIFLPALFLLAVALNPLTSRIRFQAAETALLLACLVLFLFLNLAPVHEGGWILRGTWIARIYQPVFPVLIFFAARWWQNLPDLRPAPHALIGLAIACVMLGDGLIVFGPILNNPLRLSEFAFYRFYNHTADHGVYEATLRNLGRRPLGFPRPQPAPPTPGEYLAQLRNELGGIRSAIEANRNVLAENRKALLATAQALAPARQELRKLGLESRPSIGQNPPEQGAAGIPAANPRPGGSGTAQEAKPDPSTADDFRLAIGDANRELSGLQSEIASAQADLARAQSDLTAARSELDAAQRKAANAQRP